jgi:hypothetical protein
VPRQRKRARCEMLTHPSLWTLKLCQLLERQKPCRRNCNLLHCHQLGYEMNPMNPVPLVQHALSANHVHPRPVHPRFPRAEGLNAFLPLVHTRNVRRKAVANDAAPRKKSKGTHRCQGKDVRTKRKGLETGINEIEERYACAYGMGY